MPNASVTTADELLALREPGRHELVRGELRSTSFAGHWHGAVVARVASHLGRDVRLAGLGRVYGAGTGFLLARDPDTVLAPDVAFVRRERVPSPGPGFFPGPPDLAVEVTSPDESFGKVQQKALSWLAHGAREVWVVDPVARTVTVYRPDEAPRHLDEGDELRSDDVVEGFAIAVRELFPSPPSC